VFAGQLAARLAQEYRKPKVDLGRGASVARMRRLLARMPGRRDAEPTPDGGRS
jgi:hypothetical protein